MSRPKSLLKTEFIQSRISTELADEVRAIVKQSPGATASDFLKDAISLHLKRRKYAKAKSTVQSVFDIDDPVLQALQRVQKTLEDVDASTRKTEAWLVLIARELGVQI